MGGCHYCNNRSFSPNTRFGAPVELAAQMERGIAFYRKRGGRKFIPYFQSYTNTYAPVAYLHALYERALAFPDVVGLAVGTRPDCVDEEVVELLAAYASEGFFVILEIGLETSHDETLRRINRGHTYAEFERAVRMAKAAGLFVTTHLILGLPGESRDMILQTARRISELGLDALKLHHFYVARGTLFEKMYRQGKIAVMDEDAYVALACDFIRHFPCDTYVERWLGELNPDYVVAPRYSSPKPVLIEKIRRRLAETQLPPRAAVEPCLTIV